MIATAHRPRQAATNTNAWVRLPNEVVRDPQLSPAALVLLAYRATFKGNYALNLTALRRRPIVRGRGLGRDVIKRALRVCCEAGYLRRWQAPSSGDRSFSRARERLVLPDTDKGWCILRRLWFAAAKLSVNEMAAYLYYQAGTGKGPGTYAAELAERFGWSRPTAAAATSALARFGLITRVTVRVNGRVRSMGYQAAQVSNRRGTKPCTNVKISGKENCRETSKIQSTRNQSTRFQSTYIYNPLYALSSSKKEPFSHSAPARANETFKPKPEVGHGMSELIQELKAAKAQREQCEKLPRKRYGT